MANYDISTHDISTYEYELIKRRELNYEYMLACKKCLEMEDAFCDFEELRKVIADKLRAKKAYELQEKVVQFALHEYKAFIKARNAFRSEIEAKTHFLEKSVAKKSQ
jgi:hypothetical protein